MSFRYSLLFVAVILYLIIFFGRVLLSPNSYLFSDQGDGLKNYYTYAYFIKNNSSLTNFEGMNYPYGENIMYTDCHPLIAYLLKFLNRYFPGISDHSIGILNIILILSSGLTIFLLFYIFRELKINYLLALLSAIGITSLSPQILRISSHLALAHSFFIPLTVLLILLYEYRKNQIRILIFMTISLLIFYFIHAYLGMIAATLVATYVFVRILHILLVERTTHFKKQIFLLLATIFSVGAFYLFIKITDVHTGRTTNPWGIFESFATPGTVFVPHFTPMNAIKVFFFPNLQQSFEGLAYIGLLTNFGLLFYLTISIIMVIKTKRIGWEKTWIDNTVVRLLLTTSILLLLFSMLLPFRLNLEEWINYFNIIKQFRAVGRFAWVFYFISAITVVFILNKAFLKLKEKKRIIWGYVLIILAAAVTVFEGQHYQFMMAEKILQSSNLFDVEQNSKGFRNDIEEINPANYQAILAFPFFYIGSDNYGKHANEKIYQLSMLFSYHLKIPAITSYLSRTSIDESKKIMQLMASNFYHKRIQDDLHDKRPLLVVCQKINLSKAELSYINNARLISERDEYCLYDLPIEIVFENTAAQESESFIRQKHLLFEKDEFMVSDTSLFFAFEDFNWLEDALSISGNHGSFRNKQKYYSTFYSIDPGRLLSGNEYTVRFWIYNYGENFGQDCLGGIIFVQKRTRDNLEWITPLINAGNSHEINGQWSMVELSFVCSTADSNYDFVIKGSDISEKEFIIDDLLVYDSRLNLYRIIQEGGDSILFHNNHRVALSSKNVP